MDTAQILLITVVSIIALLLLILGVQVFLILKEVRTTLTKANKVLDDAGVISSSISTPVSSLSTILSGVKLGQLIASFISEKKRPEGHVKEK